jgi:hypothetical protein
MTGVSFWKKRVSGHFLLKKEEISNIYDRRFSVFRLDRFPKFHFRFYLSLHGPRVDNPIVLAMHPVHDEDRSHKNGKKKKSREALHEIRGQADDGKRVHFYFPCSAVLIIGIKSKIIIFFLE